MRTTAPEELPGGTDPRSVLDLPMGTNDAEAATVRDYLVALLGTLWRDGANFSGKRPFGNSGWAFDLYVPLARAGLIAGTFDEDGYLDEVDSEAGGRLIAATIRYLGTP